MAEAAGQADGPARDGVALGILNRAASQRIGADADAVVVHVAGLHHVAERQRLRPAAGHEVGPGVAPANGDDQLRRLPIFVLAGMHQHVEVHREPQLVAEAVVVSLACRWAAQNAYAGRSRYDESTPHAMVRLLLHGNDARWIGEDVSCTVLDAANFVLCRMHCVRRNADAVVVFVLRLHGVAEPEPRRPAAGDVQRPSAVGADGQVEPRETSRATGEVDGLGEGDLDDDVLSPSVGVAAGRCGDDLHALHGRHDAVHVVSDHCPRREPADGGIAAQILDGSPAQRVGGDAQAIAVLVAGLHDVAEDEPPGERTLQGRASGERPWPSARRIVAKGEIELRPAAHADVVVEVHLDVDVVADAVGVVQAGIGPDDDRLNDLWTDGVHAMARLGAQHRCRDVHAGIGRRILEVAAVEGIGRDADAVVVGVAVLHDVLEREAARGHRRCRRRRDWGGGGCSDGRRQHGIPRPGADGQAQPELGVVVRLDRLVEIGADFDGVAGGVVAVVARIGGNHELFERRGVGGVADQGEGRQHQRAQRDAGGAFAARVPTTRGQAGGQPVARPLQGKNALDHLTSL